MNDPKNCVICRAGDRRNLVEHDWSSGLSMVAIAKIQTEAGWKLSTRQVSVHLKNHVAGAATRMKPELTKRDAAIYFRDKIMEEFEKREGEYEDGTPLLDILSPNLQPSIGSALRAQQVIDKREAVQAKSGKIDMIWMMLGGGHGENALAPAHLIEDGLTIEGEAVEIDSDD